MRIRRAVLPLALALFGVAGLAVAEDLDVGKLVDEGKAAASGKHYSKALQSLTLAISEIWRLRMEALKGLFPAAKEGWETGEIETQSNFGMLAGAGFATLKRTYTKGEAAYDAELVIDAPSMVAPFRMVISGGFNQPGTQVVTVQGRKALLRWEKDAKSGELTVLLNAGDAILTIRGRQVEKADLEAHAGSFSLEVIEKAIVD